MYFEEIWLDEGNPVYVFGKDNNIWIMSLEKDVLEKEKVKQAMLEYMKQIREEYGIANVFTSNDFDVRNYIINEELYTEELEDDF